ncbi:hypothetical protein GEMRC1_001927 [Eukaryota sp. GEM-RC1]
MHPLSSVFTFFFCNRVKATQSYTDAIKQICSVNSVESFFEAYQHLKRPSEFAQETNLFLFCHTEDGEPITPEWEHPANANGGRFIIRAGKDHVDFLWESLVFELVSGSIFDYAPNVTGISVSCRSREIVLNIWCSSVNDSISDELKPSIRELLSLPEETSIRFQQHNSNS